jgi:hypothetical protein
MRRRRSNLKRIPRKELEGLLGEIEHFCLWFLEKRGEALARER